MESTNSKPSEGVAGTAIEWRTQVPVQQRHAVIKMLSDWLMKVGRNGPEDPDKIQRIATKFEEKVFSEATSQDDYEQRICGKLRQRRKESVPRSSPPSRVHPVEHSMQQRPQESVPMSSPPSRVHPVEHSMQQRPQELVLMSSPPSRVHPVERSMQQRPQESVSRSSPPSRAHPVECSIYQVAPQPQLQGPGPGQPSEMQHGLQKHPSSVVKRPPPHQRPVIHDQGTKLNQQYVTPQQQQSHPHAINNQLNDQQRAAVPDLLTQQRNLYGLQNQSGGNMHQLGRQVKDSNLNGRHIDMQSDQGNLPKVPKTQPRMQVQPVLLQTSGSQPGKQPSNIGMQSDQGNLLNGPKTQLWMQAQPALPQTSGLEPGKQPSNIAMQSDQGNLLRVPKTQPRTQAKPALLQTSGLQARKQQPHPYQMHMQLQENNTQVMNQGTFQTMHPLEDDWKDKLFQKITNLKNVFLPALKVKHGELTKTLQKIGADKKTAEYETLKKKIDSYRKVYGFLNFSRDKMSEEVLKWLPNCERSLHQLLQENNQGHNPSPQQKILSTSDAQSLMVTSQMEDRQHAQHQMTETLPHHMKQGRLNHHQQSTELVAQHNSLFNKASNVNRMQGMGAGTENYMQTNSLGKCSLINHQLVKSEPISTPDTNILEKSPENIGHSSSSPFSVDRGEQSLNSGSELRESSVPEEPIQRLIKAASSLSHFEFKACVSDMDSVLQAIDRGAGQLAGNLSEKFLGDDLAGLTTCRFGLMKKDVCSQTMQTNSYATAPQVRFFESGMINDGLYHLTDPEASNLESSIATHEATPTFEANCNLLEEIRKINLKLIETVVEISQNDIFPGTLVSNGEGTVVKCSYTPVANSTFLPAIMPLRLLVPTNYPAYSPMILDDQISDEFSAMAKSKLKLSLQFHHQPWSLADIVRTWDTCARAVMTEFAQRFGGGSFSSTYGTWESSVS